MAIQNFKIDPRFCPSEEEQIKLNKRIEEYNIAFDKQEEVMTKEIGIYIEVRKYLILLKSLQIPEKSKCGIYKTDREIERCKKEYDVGLVIGIGEEAYREPNRFPFGPMCKVGDWVYFARFEQAPNKYNGYDCFTVMDDKINYPIPSPEITFPELY